MHHRNNIRSHINAACGFFFCFHKICLENEKGKIIAETKYLTKSNGHMAVTGQNGEFFNLIKF